MKMHEHGEWTMVSLVIFDGDRPRVLSAEQRWYRGWQKPNFLQSLSNKNTVVIEMTHFKNGLVIKRFPRTNPGP